MQEALTVRPPHVLLLPHPSFDADKLSILIERLEVISAAPSMLPSFIGILQLVDAGYSIAAFLRQPSHTTTHSRSEGGVSSHQLPFCVILLFLYGIAS